MHGIHMNTTTGIVFCCIFCVALAAVADCRCAPVARDEAARIADLWYAMELNSGRLEITEKEKLDRIAGLQKRRVFCLISRDELVETTPGETRVWAYVVLYEPGGFIVVSGDDRFEPVLVYDTVSPFRWDQPERNFLRYYLGEEYEYRWNELKAAGDRGEAIDTDPDWAYLRSELKKGTEPERAVRETLEGNLRGSMKWLPTALWGQGEYYNETVRAHNGGIDVPTGCVATAMAIKMKFHECPPSPQGSHSYTDAWGDVQYSHSVNFNEQTYDWSSMPETSLTSPNSHVADLMYHCGITVYMDYEEGGSGAWCDFVLQAMECYFKYYGATIRLSSHEQPMIASLDGELPVIACGGGHAFLVTGYLQNGSLYFYINCGWEGSNNAWYVIDGLPWGYPSSTIAFSLPYSRPASNIYVDSDWTGVEYGTMWNPYNTLLEGVWNLRWDCNLWINNGTYTGGDNVPITFDRGTAIRCDYGTAIVGNCLRLTTAGCIRLYTLEGKFKIYGPGKKSDSDLGVPMIYHSEEF